MSQTQLANATSQSSSLRSQRIALLLLAGIMVGGLLLRLIFFSASVPSAGAPYIRDEGNYVGLAVPLSQGQGFVDKWVWIRPPGYPLFMAAVLALSGGSLSAVALVQIILSVLNIGLVYVLALEVFGTRPDVPPGRARAVGLFAAGLMALNPHMVFYANLFMTETLYLLALTIVVWALMRAVRLWHPAPSGAISRQAMFLIASAALVTAAGVLMRSLLLAFVPLLLAWFWWALPRSPENEARGALLRRWSRRALAPLALFLVVMFAAMLPWVVRNYAHYHRFLLVDTTGSYNFWRDNDVISSQELNSRLEAIVNPADRDQYATQQALAP